MILIVGAGIAGLSCALALAPFSDVLVVERRSAGAANAGAGIQLSPNAVKALGAIGARDDVAARAKAPPGLVVRSAGRATALTTFDYGTIMNARFGAPYLTLSRAALHQGLAATVAQTPAITVLFDSQVEAIAPAGNGWRIAPLGLEAEFVVGADGVNSALRLSLLGDRAAPTPHVAWRGSLPHGGAEHTALVLGPHGHLVRYGLSDGRDNLVLIVPERAQHPSQMQRTPLGREIEHATAWTPWPIKVRHRHHYGRATVALAGDAAHAMPPFLAQGGAMALEDAATLKAAVARHDLTPAAQSAYAAARYERTRRLAAQTRRQGLIYHLAPPLSFARDHLITRLGARGILAQVSWIYDWSPPEVL